MTLRTAARHFLAFSFFALTLSVGSWGQEKSVKPGINDPFKNPDVAKYVKTFEGESREVYANRDKIIAECQVRPGMVVADVGAGTGLFTRLFAKAVGPQGQVIAVDISEKFLEHIQKSCQEAKITNVKTWKCSETSTELPAHSVDLVFICDTYHHFEYPYRTMQSIHQALKPGGRVVLIDFHRIPGKSSDFILGHVRAGQEVFIKEIEEVGFKLVREVKDLLKENYMVVFEKVPAEKEKSPGAKRFPVIAGYGGVFAVPGDDGPRKGSKVVFDVTADAKEAGQPVPGLERAALLYNLAGQAGLQPTDIDVVIVMHGATTPYALSDAAYQKQFGRANPQADLIRQLKKAGAKIYVCGQSLARNGFDPLAVSSELGIVAAALTAVMNKQADGYAYIPAH
ncbi:MAG: methyltransferase domain-containing protein [Gemmataceae bacterium]|nr:methyltransferase domain-containing protein [Gemmata sp.]MDW8198040.1 methyltransferase domain-containing protein [Gemmataceae bacterium]